MMDSQLWSRLPFEIIERVLSFLPVPDLCRYCVVCKRWKSLISTSKFGSLSLQNAKKRRCNYIVARCVVEPDPGYLSWSILDVEARKWYSIKEYDLPEAVGECENVPSILGFAADGGLVCEYTEDVNFGVVSLIEVCNPLSKSDGRYVPLPPEHLVASPSDALIHFVVDEVDNSFKVFFIYKRFNYEYEHEFPERALLHIYESVTGEWRSSTNPPLDMTELGIGDYGSSIMFQGLLYVLFSSYDHQNFWLFRYNIVEDVWEDTNVEFELGSLCWPQLIVSNSCLFLVSWMVDELDKSHRHCRLYVEEILLVDKALSMVFQMTGDIVKLVFHLPDLGGRCSEIQAFGFEKAIMLMSRKTGISIVYDLVLGLWSQVPTNPMEPLPAGYQLWYGKPMNLRLPSIPW